MISLTSLVSETTQASNPGDLDKLGQIRIDGYSAPKSPSASPVTVRNGQQELQITSIIKKPSISQIRADLPEIPTNTSQSVSCHVDSAQALEGPVVIENLPAKGLRSSAPESLLHRMPLKLIEREKHRNTTFMKRRVVITKKTMELGRLCDIATLLICFGPRGQLETWPPDPQEVHRIIDHYRSLWQDEKSKRRYDLATFFKAHQKKLEAELAREREVWLDIEPVESLEELSQSLDAKLAAIENRIGRLRLEEESPHGMGIELLGQLQHMQEDAPPLAFDAIFDAQPIQSYVDFCRVKTENFGGEGLQLHPAAAAASLWEAPHGLCRSEMPCTVTRSTPADPYMSPTIFNPDDGFGMDNSCPYQHCQHLDDLLISSPFLAMDYAAYPIAAGASYSSMVDGLNPTTAFPMSFCHDTALGYSVGGSSTGIIRNISNKPLPPFDQSVLDAGYGSMHRFPASNRPAVLCNDVYRQNELYGTEFVQDGRTVGTSLAETWPTSIFLDLPPTTDCSSNASAQAVAPGGDDSSKVLPTSATNRYAKM